MELKYKHLYKTVLKEYQNLSKCSRMKVAALLVEKGRIISCGYNGTPSGQVNCNEIFKSENGKFYLRDNKEEEWKEVPEMEWRAKHHEFANEQETFFFNDIWVNCKREYFESQPEYGLIAIFLLLSSY